MHTHIHKCIHTIYTYYIYNYTYITIPILHLPIALSIYIYLLVEGLDTAAMSHTDKKKQEKIGLCISTDHGLSEDFISGISVSFLSPISRPQPVMPSFHRIGLSPHQH